jgi:hypothetical protein
MVPHLRFARDGPGKDAAQRSSANGHAISAAHRMPLRSSPGVPLPRVYNETETSRDLP